jgi:lysophospholipase L1-like esterase
MARKKITPATVLILFTALVIHGLNPEPADSQKTGPAGVQELSAGILRFDFGQGEPKAGFVKVGPGDEFSVEKGFGFRSGSALTTGVMEGPGEPGSEPGDRDFILSADPYLFLASVPEGNYLVRVTAGGVSGDSRLTLKAESRRLMAMNVLIPEGETRTIEFSTNVRYPEVDSGLVVRLKPGEIGNLNWDRQLSVEFSGTNIAISSVEIVPDEKAITLYLAGNSTVTDQRYEPYSAWGQVLPVFFKPGVVSVANHAESGEALKSFVAENRLDKLMQTMRPGDYLFIQFGHNDQKTQSPAYAAPFGDYQEYLRKFIREARVRGAIPVLVTPMLRRKFDDKGHIINTHGDYPEAMRQVAEEELVALIDLFEMSRILYEALGPDDSKELFVYYPAGTFPGQEGDLKDDSHHSSYGAYELAKCIVNGIREKLPELALALRHDIPEFDPAHPDPFSSWHLPLDPIFNPETPEGK